MNANLLVKAQRIFAQGFTKAAKTCVPNHCKARREAAEGKREVFPAHGAEGPGDCAKRTWADCGDVSKEKAEVLELLGFDPGGWQRAKDLVGEFKECLTVPSPERAEFLGTLRELGVRLPMRVLCCACDPKDSRCDGCRLWKPREEIHGSTRNDPGEKRHDC